MKDETYITVALCEVKHKEVDDLKNDVSKIYDKLDSFKMWMFVVLGGIIANLAIALIRSK